MSEVTLAPRPGSFWSSFLVVLAGFLLCGTVLVWFYLPRRPAPLPASDTRTAAELETLYKKVSEARTEQKAKAESYGWVDRAQGRVRIPVAQAMEIVLAEEGARQR